MPRINRQRRIAQEAVDIFELDLSGQTVYTEGASGPYLWTPLIAALAGADAVYCITKDSKYGSAAQITERMNSQAAKLNVDERVRVVWQKKEEHLSKANIVTNSGFVRPIDGQMVSWMKEGTVIPLMWEAWEFRPEDINVAACREKNIKILGTNEDDPRLKTWDYVGLTVAKALLYKRIEILNSNILLLGSGKFKRGTQRILEKLGACVADESSATDGGFFDAVVCLEYEDRQKTLVGPDGVVNTKLDLLEGTPVIHVCGRVSREFIEEMGWELFPEGIAAPGNMSLTTAYVGPKPVIRLNAAGLRVAQAYLNEEEHVLSELAQGIE